MCTLFAILMQERCCVPILHLPANHERTRCLMGRIGWLKSVQRCITEQGVQGSISFACPGVFCPKQGKIGTHSPTHRLRQTCTHHPLQKVRMESSRFRVQRTQRTDGPPLNLELLARGATLSTALPSPARSSGFGYCAAIRQRRCAVL